MPKSKSHSKRVKRRLVRMHGESRPCISPVAAAANRVALLSREVRQTVRSRTDVGFNAFLTGCFEAEHWQLVGAAYNIVAALSSMPGGLTGDAAELCHEFAELVVRMGDRQALGLSTKPSESDAQILNAMRDLFYQALEIFPHAVLSKAEGIAERRQESRSNLKTSLFASEARRLETLPPARAA